MVQTNQYEKYEIKDERFSIQYLKEKRFSSMRNDHYHSSYEMFYILNGSRIFYINGIKNEAKKGDLWCIQPNDRHRTKSTDEFFCERFVINFSSDWLNSFGNIIDVHSVLSTTKKVSFTIQYQLVLEDLFHKLFKEARDKKYEYEEICQTIHLQLLLLIKRHIHYQEKGYSENHHLIQKMNELKIRLEQSDYKTISLEGIAQEFHLSEAYFSRMFQKINGITFKNYLVHLRVKMAKNLLKDTLKSVEAISRELGYRHCSNFINSFKKITGHTPYRYRMMVKENKN
ncbi:putative response regulator [Bacillus sp. TS-2]|nr:putative response regulator [Bacillus sp. TS-2]